MKKPIVTALAAVALSAGAHAETKFYGKFNVSTAYNDSTEEFTVDSHASRLGIKGSDDLGFATLVYKAEYQHNVDDGSANGNSSVKARSTYVGLKYDGLGTVKLGKMDTPLKKSQGKFDLFNDVYDIKRGLAGENRENNSINYTSEKLGSVQVSAAAILNEGGSDGYSVSGVLKQGNLFASVAYDKDVDFESTIRATAIFTQGDIRLGALVNRVEEGSEDDIGYAFNAALTKGLHTFKAQFGTADQVATGAQALTVGVDRKLAKTTTAYLIADSYEADLVDTVNEVRVGLVHKF